MMRQTHHGDTETTEVGLILSLLRVLSASVVKNSREAEETCYAATTVRRASIPSNARHSALAAFSAAFNAASACSG